MSLSEFYKSFKLFFNNLFGIKTATPLTIKEKADLDIQTEGEKEIIKGLKGFGAISVKQVMKARMEITSLDFDLNFTKLLQEIIASGFSRLPVYCNSIDNIEGILYIKDLFPHLSEGADFHWQKLIRTAYFIPETKKIQGLLKEFQLQHLHMAIVVDEYGGVAGLVTMEDILEEIVGEIEDEHDDEHSSFVKVNENTFTFEGKTSINDFCKAVNVDPSFFGEMKGESESIGGLLVTINSNVPAVGQSIKLGPFTFNILSADYKSIDKITVLIEERDEVKQSIVG
ncbi:MAG TPA: transporter associated domain-containing protein [Cytophagaceae bacterium]|jgi:CBS domain containing-hemolysin-like protein